MPAFLHLLAALPGAAATWVYRRIDQALLRMTRPTTNPTTEETRNA